MATLVMGETQVHLRVEEVENLLRHEDHRGIVSVKHGIAGQRAWTLEAKSHEGYDTCPTGRRQYVIVTSAYEESDQILRVAYDDELRRSNPHWAAGYEDPRTN